MRRGLFALVALSLGRGEPDKSHMSACTELCFGVNDRFLQSSSVSLSPRGGNREDGMRMDGLMMSSPRMVLSLVDSARKLVALVLYVADEETLELADSA